MRACGGGRGKPKGKGCASFDTHNEICVEADPPVLGRKSHLRRMRMRGGHSSPRRTRSTLKVHKTQAQLKEDFEAIAGRYVIDHGAVGVRVGHCGACFLFSGRCPSGAHHKAMDATGPYAFCGSVLTHSRQLTCHSKFHILKQIQQVWQPLSVFRQVSLCSTPRSKELGHPRRSTEICSSSRSSRPRWPKPSKPVFSCCFPAGVPLEHTTRLWTPQAPIPSVAQSLFIPGSSPATVNYTS